MNRVKGRVEEVDEWIQAQEDKVEEDGGLILIHNPGCDWIWSKRRRE
jgi:hypothetical protein